MSPSDILTQGLGGPLTPPASTPTPTYAKPGPYTTQLPPVEEAVFRKWLQDPYDQSGRKMGGHVMYDPEDRNPDYDMRGFWKGMVSGDPRATTGINAFDKKLHFTDYWKTPKHETFSNESKYALQGAGAPAWVGDDKTGWKLVASDGRVIKDETPPELQNLRIPKRKK